MKLSQLMDYFRPVAFVLVCAINVRKPYVRNQRTRSGSASEPSKSELIIAEELKEEQCLDVGGPSPSVLHSEIMSLNSRRIVLFSAPMRMASTVLRQRVTHTSVLWWKVYLYIDCILFFLRDKFSHQGKHVACWQDNIPLHIPCLFGQNCLCLKTITSFPAVFDELLPYRRQPANMEIKQYITTREELFIGWLRLGEVFF